MKNKVLVKGMCVCKIVKGYGFKYLKGPFHVDL
jgi:hypothetical protein